MKLLKALGFCLAGLLTLPCLSESTQSSSANIAYLYVQVAKGVNVYDVSSAGKLTLVKGSPFAISGQMEGVTASHLISVGTTNIHTYAVSGGAIGKQQSSVDTQDYSGSECGTTSFDGVSNGALLDHTGRYFFVQLYEDGSDAGEGDCAAWQSYQIESDGSMLFLGSIEYEGWEDAYASSSTVPTVSSSDKFAYGVFAQFSGYEYTTFSSFTLNPEGIEENQKFTGTNPPTNPSAPDGPWYFFPVQVAADPQGHLAALLVSETFSTPDGAYGPLQLASYSINKSTGGIASANTWENMPIPAVKNITNISMSNSGKLVAVYGTGFQLFHFNGASPLTKYTSTLLPSATINQIAWDDDNHLFALSYSTGKLYVYTATPTSMTEVASYSVPAPYGSLGMVAVPK